MALPGPLLPKRPFPRATDFPRRWQTRLRETLLLREVIVFDERGLAVGVEFCQEEIMHQSDLRFERGDCKWREGGGGRKRVGEGGGETAARKRHD